MTSIEKDSNKEILHKLPIMHPNIDQRVKIVNEKSKMALMHYQDPESIENYPLRDFIKIEVFFKLFLFFILFGGHIKGYNIPFFISLLVLYYWYCLYSDISAFYDKKISEFKLSASDLKELKFLDYDSDDEKVLEKAEDEEYENLQKKFSQEEVRKKSLDLQLENLNIEKLPKEELNNLNNNKNFKPEAVDDINIENLNNINLINYNNDEKNINKIHPEFKEIKLENVEQDEVRNSKKIYENELEDISHLINKIESKKAKKLEKEKNNEGFIT
jgi:hypothetical protein